MHGTLANFLLNLTVRAGSGGQKRNTFRLRVRREDLADHLDLTLVELEGEFERLSALGVISVTAHDFVTVLDQSGLEMQRLRRPERRVDGERGRSANEEVERADVEGALAKVLADERFIASPRSADLLAYLVRKTLDGEAHRLDAARIAVEALGKPSGFRPHLDPNLHAPLEQLRRMLENYHATERGADIEIYLAVGTYRVMFDRLEQRTA